MTAKIIKMDSKRAHQIVNEYKEAKSIIKQERFVLMEAMNGQATMNQYTQDQAAASGGLDPDDFIRLYMIPFMLIVGIIAFIVVCSTR